MHRTLKITLGLIFLVLPIFYLSLCLDHMLGSAVSLAASAVDYPEVPRISAYEAAEKFRAGKAILLQADEAKVYSQRRVVGALNYFSEAVEAGKVRLPRFPRKGIEIITFCF